jgi:predicted nucleic acid-binding protein
LDTIFSIDRVLLKKVCSNIIIPRIVYYEIKNRVDSETQKTIKSLTRSKFVILEDFDIYTPEYKFYKSLIKGIECKCRGKCESAAITIAKENNLTILSNYEKDYITEYNLNTISLVDMLRNAYNTELITLSEAEKVWKKIPNSIREYSSFAQFIKLDT